MKNEEKKELCKSLMLSIIKQYEGKEQTSGVMMDMSNDIVLTAIRFIEASLATIMDSNIHDFHTDIVVSWQGKPILKNGTVGVEPPAGWTNPSSARGELKNGSTLKL